MHPPTVGPDFAELVAVMHRLRAPGGCPWDREQTHETLRPFLIEETAEVLEAIADGAPAAICDELGDLLLQIVFHAELASEEGTFDIGDVIRGLTMKLVRRHPHVFGDVTVSGSADVVANWQRIKAAERPDSPNADPFGNVPEPLPALARAQKLGGRAARVGFDWDGVQGVLAKLREELQELEQAVAAADSPAALSELGDLLLTATSVARHLRGDAETALRDATDRLRGRLRACAAHATATGSRLEELDAASRDRLWEEVKRRV